MRMRGLALLAVLVLTVVAWMGGVPAAGAGTAAGLCANPQKMQGFSTCADVAAAEREGALVVYTPDVEQGTSKMLEAFQALFPKIKTNYVRLQTGALYAKVQAERQARTYVTDVLNLSDIGLVFDFEKRNGYQRYVSPEMSAYKPEYKSHPEGNWTWGSINVGGIAYNPKVVPPDQAPKSWEDLLDSKWKGSLNVKTSNSGLQHFVWYMLTKELGAEFWQKLAQQEPRAFDSYVQQFDRLVNGQDKVAESAQYSGFLEFKRKGAPLEFVLPARGVPAGPEVWGIVDNAPHPNAARLFLDWFLAPVGQKPFMDALLMHSPRLDVPPPPGAAPLSSFKLLFPSDWPDFLGSRAAYLKQWDAMVGRR
jgi:iron(III) transport system substrate-binding protein